MKIILPFLFLFCTAVKTQAQSSIPNAGFESWTTFGTSPTDYEDPTGWKSGNGSVAFSFRPVKKSTDSHTGTYAAEIEVTSVFGMNTPVILTNGNVPDDFTDFVIDYDKAGTPISIKPTSVSGYYKFLPAAASFDSAYAVVILKRWNSVTMSSDTVGFGSTVFSPAAVYTAFNIPVTYSSSELPDSIVVAFVNEATETPTFNPAGKLLIDDVSLDTLNSDIADISNAAVSVYPNPLSSASYVTLPANATPADCVFTLYNVLGETVRQVVPRSTTFVVHRDNLSPGLYFYKLSRRNGPVDEGKLMVE